MADITNLFRATVKTVKIKEKSLGSSSVGPDKSILPSQKAKSEFSSNAKNVVSSISKLRDFLLDHRKEYINASGCFGSEQTKLTDAERDQIDSDAELFMKTCSEAIKQLKLQANSHKVLRQVKEHKDVILDLIDKYLFAVCQLYSEQRAIRVKRVVDKKRISRLEPEGIATQNTKNNLSAPGTESSSLASSSTNIRPTNLKESLITSQSTPIDGLLVTTDEEEINTLSPEEAQMLQMENEQLYTEMSSMVDEIKQIEGKIVEISRLQEIFADKVLEQEQDIDKIADTVVGTTENIKEANEEIREAMKNNAGFRIWILFFLIVCSFSLLFLDWYNA